MHNIHCFMISYYRNYSKFFNILHNLQIIDQISKIIISKLFRNSRHISDSDSIFGYQTNFSSFRILLYFI